MRKNVFLICCLTMCCLLSSCYVTDGSICDIPSNELGYEDNDDGKFIRARGYVNSLESVADYVAGEYKYMICKHINSVYRYDWNQFNTIRTDYYRYCNSDIFYVFNSEEIKTSYINQKVPVYKVSDYTTTIKQDKGLINSIEEKIEGQTLEEPKKMEQNTTMEDNPEKHKLNWGNFSGLSY